MRRVASVNDWMVSKVHERQYWQSGQVVGQGGGGGGIMGVETATVGRRRRRGMKDFILVIRSWRG